MTYDDYCLAHYGILGMRWGKRNGPPYPLSSSQMTSEERNNNTPKSAKDMSDEELNKAINRLRKEKEYDQLTSSNVKTGKDWVKAALVAIGGVAFGAFTGYVGKKIGVEGGKAVVGGAAAGAAFVKEVADLLKNGSIPEFDQYRYLRTPDEIEKMHKEKKK